MEEVEVATTELVPDTAEGDPTIGVIEQDVVDTPEGVMDDV